MFTISDPQFASTCKDKENNNYYQNIESNDVLNIIKVNTKKILNIDDNNREEKKSYLLGINKFQFNYPTAQIFSDDLPIESYNLLGWFARTNVEKSHPRSISHIQRKDNNNNSSAIVCSEVMCIKLNSNLLQTFHELVLCGFSSLPIIDDENKFINDGIDLLDLLFYLLRNFGTYRDQELLNDPYSKSWSWTKFLQLQNIKEATVQNAIQRPIWATTRKPYHSIKQGYSLLSLVELIVREHVHRAVIINKLDSKPITIITRSMILSLIQSNLPILGSIAHHKVSNILPFLLPDSLVKINENQYVNRHYEERSNLYTCKSMCKMRSEPRRRKQFPTCFSSRGYRNCRIDMSCKLFYGLT